MSFKPGGTLVPKEETAKNSVLLADLVRTKYAEQGLVLPTLVVIPRSGLEIANIISTYLSIGASSILQAAVERITPPNQSTDKRGFKIGQFPTKKQVENEHLLVIDSVCRSGETLALVSKKLSKLGAASVKSAVIYDMTPINVEATTQRFKPDYFIDDGRSLGYAIFHWEWEEMVAERQQQQRIAALQEGTE